MNKAQSCLIIAGEKSGEEHALSFFPGLKAECPNLKFFGVAGDDLKDRGVDLIYHLNDFSSWGISGVITKIPFYKKAMEKLLEEVEHRQAKVAILIDFQTFNMKLAKKLTERGVKVLYYVAPQAWAWKAYRTKALARDTEVLFTILPFEKEWFRSREVGQVYSTVHPLALRYPSQLNKVEDLQTGREIRLLLLPGSRGFEVNSLLPEFLKTADVLRDLGHKLKIGLVKSRSLKADYYDGYGEKIDQIWSDDELEVGLKWADLSLAASGTVTLACALFGLPTVVAYRTSLLNEFIFHTFVNYQGAISLANIVQGSEVYPELLQDEVSSFNLANKLLVWIENPEYLRQTREKLARTHALLSGDEVPAWKIMAQTIGRSYESSP